MKRKRYCHCCVLGGVIFSPLFHRLFFPSLSTPTLTLRSLLLSWKSTHRNHNTAAKYLTTYNSPMAHSCTLPSTNKACACELLYGAHFLPISLTCSSLLLFSSALSEQCAHSSRLIPTLNGHARLLSPLLVFFQLPRAHHVLPLIDAPATRVVELQHTPPLWADRRQGGRDG